MKRRGFTLIELLVVIGIIAILMAILIPALGHVKGVAQKASTTALLSQLEASIGQYYTTFNAYPGPGSLTDTTGKSGTKALSGAQNMLLGLSYAVYPANVTSSLPGASVPVAFNQGPAHVYTGSPTGPINYGASNLLSSVQGQQLSPFFTVTSKNTATFAASKVALPLVIDTFSDPLPVLYYRRTPGVDAPFALSNAVNAYYSEENQEYTSGQVTSPTGAVFPQNNSVDSAYLCGPTGIAVSSGTNGTGAAARGGYILMSAGLDRTYGNPSTRTGTADRTKPSDDIVVIGGD